MPLLSLLPTPRSSMPQGPIAIRVLSEVMATSAHVKVVREFPGPLVGSASVSAVTSYLGNTSLLEEASRALGITDPMQDAVLLNHALQVWVGGGHVRCCSESSGRWGHLAVPFLMFLGGCTHLCVWVCACVRVAMVPFSPRRGHDGLV